MRGSTQGAGSSAGSGALQPVASAATDADAALPEPRADAGSLLDEENSGAEEASEADSGDAANDAIMQELKATTTRIDDWLNRGPYLQEMTLVSYIRHVARVKKPANDSSKAWLFSSTRIIRWRENIAKLSWTIRNPSLAS